MAEDIAAFHGRLKAVEQMKVRAADSAGRDLDDRVARVLYFRVGDRVDTNVAFSVPA
jgi:hypothetical protein